MASQDTLAVYAADWALFADWCAGNDVQALPAGEDVVLDYLRWTPAALGTLSRRTTAIDHVHLAAGFSPPGRGTMLRARLGRDTEPRLNDDVVATALASAAVQGLPDGLVGRRDACLLAVIGVLGWTRDRAAGSSLRDVTLLDLPVGESPGECARCAVARWLRVRSLADQRGWTTVRREMAGQGVSQARHQHAHNCAVPLRPAGPGSLFIAIDRHGWPSGEAGLSIRTMSALVAAMMRSTDPVRADMMDDVRMPAGSSAGGPPMPLSHADAMAIRARAVAELADVDGALDEIAERADAMLERMRVLFESRSGT